MSGFVRRLPRPTSPRALCERLPSSTVAGDPLRSIQGIAAFTTPAADTLAFCDRVLTPELLAQTRASVVIAPVGTFVTSPDHTLIVVDDVRAAFIDTVAWLLPNAGRQRDPAPGVDAAARVDATATVSAQAFVGAGVTVGARTRIGPGVVIYDDTRIGSDCVIGPNAVIGWVGLAYHDGADRRRRCFPHLAGVRIGNGVDVGAQTCICRGMLSHTRIGDDAKIGSLVYVSHGVTIESRSWLSAGTAVAGHAKVGERSLLGIGSVVVDNIDLGAGVLVGGGSVVTRNAGEGERLVGVPAHPAPALRRFGPTPRE